MKNLPLSILGRDRREFKASLRFFGVGCLVWILVYPLRLDRIQDSQAVQAAGFFVIGLVSLFMAINAARDKTLPPHQRDWLTIWMIFLPVWLCYHLLNLLTWWDRVPEYLRPPHFRS